ncbi:hypothetical protein TNCV_4790371 [Trichonephila clavipes]|nr:hypothetical protein TNCV_4790371 [Trichonephila clavipes]
MEYIFKRHHDTNHEANYGQLLANFGEDKLSELSVKDEKTFETNPATAIQHVRKYGGYFSVDRIFQFRQNGPDRYTRDFKYQKSAGVKSGDRGRPWVPAAPANDSVFLDICIRNGLTGLTV